MNGVISRIAWTQPEWYREESRKLSDEWLNSDTDMDIADYCYEHGSVKYREESDKVAKIIEGYATN